LVVEALVDESAVLVDESDVNQIYVSKLSLEMWGYSWFSPKKSFQFAFAVYFINPKIPPWLPK